ncbi:hypothetical protein ACOI1C_05315 [Bacillus sp. DJP31]
MFCIREERRDELTKKFEAIFAGLFEHPLIMSKGISLLFLCK